MFTMLNASPKVGASAARPADLQRQSVVLPSPSQIRFGNKMRLTPPQDDYVSLVAKLIAPFGQEQVQAWDEGKRPPLPVLQAFTSRGLFTSGVPLPAFEQGEALLQNPAVRAQIGPEKLARLDDLAAHPEKLADSAQYLSDLGKDGYTMAMLLPSILLPKQTSVGVTTFLGVNNGLSAQTISKIGTPAQQAFWLNALNSGVFTYGFGLTEELIGSDPLSIKTTFRKETDPQTGKTTYVLNGNKKFIGNAARVQDAAGNTLHTGADFLAVFAVDDPNKPPKERSFRVFMVPRQLIGERNIRHSGHAHNKLGLREVNNGDFDLKDVRVPEDFMLGVPDRNIYKKLMGLLDITRMFVGAMSVGSAEGSLQAAQAYASERVQNGGLINRFQSVGFPLKQIEAKALIGRLFLMETARLVDRAAAEKAALEAPIRDVRGFLAQGRETFMQLLSTLDAEQLKPATKDLLLAAAAKADKAVEKLEDEYDVRGARKAIAAGKEALDHAVSDIRKLGLPDNAKALLAQTLDFVAQAEARLSNLKEVTRFGTETAIAKLFGSELAEEASRQGINTLGGNGFIERLEQGRGLPKRYRDAKVLTIYEGTSNVQRNIIALGAMMDYNKKISGSTLLTLRAGLLANGFFKRIEYNYLRKTAKTPAEKMEAAFLYALADVGSRFQKEYKRVDKAWKAGIPAQYTGWDEDSVERQKKMEASLPVQARMHLLADMYMQKRLAETALEQIELLKRESSPEAEAQSQSLQLFVQMATDTVIEKGRELGSKTLDLLEAQYRRETGLGDA